MNSFDVFDTLIARRFLKTNSVWQQMAHEFKLDNFEHVRPGPDDGTRSFEEIYTELVRQGLIPADIKRSLMQREIELEIANCYGIKQNMDRVSDGDLLISDMYLPAPVILQMVRSAGMNKQVSIYQSNRDKGTGKIWTVLQPNPPGVHLGDNEYSDYRRARDYGLHSELYTGSNYTELEKTLYTNQLFYLAHLVREIRLRNNISLYHEYFDLSCQYNLPLIFVILELLHRNINNNITFLGRDGQLLWRIYNNYYGTAYYLPFSRKVAYTNPELASRYLRVNTAADHTLVDISSTGETWATLSAYGSHSMKAVIYSDSEHRPHLPETFSYITKNSMCGSTNLMLEIMNCANHGMLTSLTSLDEKVILTHYAEHELSQELVNAVHQPVQDAINLKQFYSDAIRKELNNKSDEFLHSVFRYLSQQICARLDLATAIPNFIERENQYHQEIITKRAAQWKN
jgi:predicted HAD superfamily hydrolase